MLGFRSLLAGIVAFAIAPTAPAGVVAIDAAHGNYHTLNGRYAPFAGVLTELGHEVIETTGPFSDAALADLDLLVIANALAPENRNRWALPTPSAFTAAEVEALHAWVAQGGSLLLIADHMPFPGAAAALAERFGVSMANGFAFGPDGTERLHFTHGDGTLASHAITADLPSAAPVTSFLGQAFTVTAGADAAPLLVLPRGAVQLLPARAWDFDDATPRHDAGGLLQGVVVRAGEGRAAIFGEAAMFTSQPAGRGDPSVGFEHPDAPGNRAFLEQVIRWLLGDLPDR